MPTSTKDRPASLTPRPVTVDQARAAWATAPATASWTGGGNCTTWPCPGPGPFRTVSAERPGTGPLLPPHLAHPVPRPGAHRQRGGPRAVLCPPWKEAPRL